MSTRHTHFDKQPFSRSRFPHAATGSNASTRPLHSISLFGFDYDGRGTKNRAYVVLLRTEFMTRGSLDVVHVRDTRGHFLMASPQ